MKKEDIGACVIMLLIVLYALSIGYLMAESQLPFANRTVTVFAGIYLISVSAIAVIASIVDFVRNELC